MTTWPVLSVTTFLPVVGAVLLYLLARGNDAIAARNARWIALWTTLITFAVSLVLLLHFDPSQPGFQFVEKGQWLGAAINYHMGVDGISLPFVILTTALMPFCILASWKSIQNRVREYMMAFLFLETLMIGTFSSLDLVLFYLFFEGGLIPMFLIIGVWGGPRRVYASFKFFLYTLLGSVLMLLAIMALYAKAGTTDIPTLMTDEPAAQSPAVGVAGVLRVLRGEDADVGRSTHGCRMRTSKRRPRAPWCSPRSC
ncbi:NAD(P)H-quinone oxidoreductase chain 4 1 [Afipia felis]|uniref:NAD(P)H-quinone oxidoreductase chain 4 1 n=1 Tax=Afipia felis TaxID=1035 RepID=A0A090MNQ1_AFIFE|nr:NAD(P)H-quinone oxidoreductase chain 4 1 [Afipia felis]